MLTLQCGCAMLSLPLMGLGHSTERKPDDESSESVQLIETGIMPIVEPPNSPARTTTPLPLKKFKCVHCEARFGNKSHLESHDLTMHSKPSVPMSPTSLPVSPSPAFLAYCTRCKMEFPNRLLEQHVAEYHYSELSRRLEMESERSESNLEQYLERTQDESTQSPAIQAQESNALSTYLNISDSPTKASNTPTQAKADKTKEILLETTISNKYISAQIFKSPKGSFQCPVCFRRCPFSPGIQIHFAATHPNVRQLQFHVWNALTDHENERQTSGVVVLDSEADERADVEMEESDSVEVIESPDRRSSLYSVPITESTENPEQKINAVSTEITSPSIMKAFATTNTSNVDTDDLGPDAIESPDISKLPVDAPKPTWRDGTSASAHYDSGPPDPTDDHSVMSITNIISAQSLLSATPLSKLTKCPECGTMEEDARLRQHHRKVHQKSVRLCDGTIVEKQDGRWHCNQCTASYTLPNVLQTHFKNKHAKPKSMDLKCLHCDMMFVSGSGRDEHIRQLHPKSPKIRKDINDWVQTKIEKNVVVSQSVTPKSGTLPPQNIIIISDGILVSHAYSLDDTISDHESEHDPSSPPEHNEQEDEDQVDELASNSGSNSEPENSIALAAADTLDAAPPPLAALNVPEAKRNPITNHSHKVHTLDNDIAVNETKPLLKRSAFSASDSDSDDEPFELSLRTNTRQITKRARRF